MIRRPTAKVTKHSAMTSTRVGSNGGLVVSKLLGQNIIKYRSLFPQVSAAIQLSNKDKHLTKGDTIKYIYTNSQHKNPLCRVASMDPINEKKENWIMTKRNMNR
jgi:DNA polymerase elongation subunit (family B)